LALLLTVLVQYTPLRNCALERVIVGSNCHDRGTHGGAGDSHAGEASCGVPDGQHECVCEQPKVEAQHDPEPLKSPVVWTHVPVATAAFLHIERVATPLPDPDPHLCAFVARQLPLLI
jgi:hypothetical protein